MTVEEMKQFTGEGSDLRDSMLSGDTQRFTQLINSVGSCLDNSAHEEKEEVEHGGPGDESGHHSHLGYSEATKSRMQVRTIYCTLHLLNVEMKFDVVEKIKCHFCCGTLGNWYLSVSRLLELSSIMWYDKSFIISHQHWTLIWISLLYVSMCRDFLKCLNIRGLASGFLLSSLTTLYKI